MENRVHTIEPEAGRTESTLAPMTDDEHDDGRRPMRRQATGDRRRAMHTPRRTAERNDERTDERINQLSYPVTECAAKKAHLLERWLAEGSRGDCTQGSAEKGVKRRDGEGMEDGRSARERGSCDADRRGEGRRGLGADTENGGRERERERDWICKSRTERRRK
ncbi:hypothetical protein WN51_03355 [Melipona quadrifasciata]|uniref:Uncharacterized protein n=1 Tax=Melipona quadrifasciata TaxID=166423 RepID=A0A0M8ZVL8_9HYME|nr:hypothetical protein WN51_03355 [Melipona quadrifasciata]